MNIYNEQLDNINDKLNNTLSSLNDLKIVETVEQGTPNITVSPTGLITSTVPQTEGYVEAGTVETTHQISETDDANLIPENIKSGVSIFGIEGSHQGGSLEEGKQAAYDEFWDEYQENGNRLNYNTAFAGVQWTANLMKPKYDMYPTSAYMMFRGNNKLIDLKQHLDDLGITLSFENCTGVQYAFSMCNFTHIGELNFTSITGFSDCFLSAPYLHTIDKIILKSDGSQNLGAKPFNGCSNLEQVRFEGVIGTTGMTINNSKLSHDSLFGAVTTEEQIAAGKNLVTIDGVTYYGGIIIALQDLTGTGTTKTLTFGATNLAKLSDVEKAIATQKGWTLT